MRRLRDMARRATFVFLAPDVSPPMLSYGGEQRWSAALAAPVLAAPALAAPGLATATLAAAALATAAPAAAALAAAAPTAVALVYLVSK